MEQHQRLYDAIISGQAELARRGVQPAHPLCAGGPGGGPGRGAQDEALAAPAQRAGRLARRGQGRAQSSCRGAWRAGSPDRSRAPSRCGACRSPSCPGQGDLALDQVLLTSTGRRRRSPSVARRRTACPVRACAAAACARTGSAITCVLAVVRRDVAAEQPGLAILEQHVAVDQLGLAGAQAFHFPARQGDARLEALFDEIVVQSLLFCAMVPEGCFFCLAIGGAL